MIVIFLFVFAVCSAFAHSGRTNSEGCHNNRKTGDYHCYNGGKASSSFEKSLETKKVEKKSLDMTCCKICKKGKACGDTCISQSYSCHQPKGCACDG